MQKAKSFDIDLEVIIGADLKSAEKKLGEIPSENLTNLQCVKRIIRH